MGDKDRIPKHLARERAQSRTGRKAHARPSSAVREDVGAYQRVLEDLGEVLIRADADGTIVEVSPSPLAYGYTAEDLIGKPAPRFYGGSEQRAALLAALAEHGEVTDYEVRLRARDGRTVVASANVRLLRRPDGTVVGAEALLRDITARKRAEEELRKAHDELEARVAERTAELLRANERLGQEIEERRRAEQAARESESKWRSLVENAPALIMTLDRDGTIQFANHGVTGAPLEEAIGSSIFRYAPPQYHDDMREVFARVFETGEIGGDFDVPWPEADGSTSWHSARVGPLRQNGEVVALTIIATEVTERNQAENALRESEERFHRLADASFEGVAVHDKGRILEASEQYASMFGYALSDVIGRHALEFTAPEWRALLAQQLESGFEGPFEAVGLRRDGTTFWGEVRAKAIPYRGRTVSVTAIRDIAERKEAEEALRESERRFRDVLSVSRDLTYRLNLQIGSFDYVSPSVLRLTGFTVKEFVALGWKGVAKRFTPDTRPHLQGIGDGQPNLSIEAEETPEVEYRWRVKNGEYRWFRDNRAPIRDEQGRPVAVVGTTSDVTERKRAEEALRESEERLREVLDASRDVIFRRSLRTDEFEYVSPAAFEVTGFTAEQHVAMGRKGADKRIHPDDLPVLDAHTERLLSSAGEEDTIPPVDYRWRHKDGEYRWMSSNRVLVRDSDGEPVAIVGTVRDITQRKRVEQALRDGEERLRTVVTNAPVILFATDSDGAFTLCDGKGLQGLGMAPGEHVGQSVFDVYRDVPVIVDHARRALAGESSTALVDLGELTFEVHCTPVRDHQGRITGGIGVAIDITERKRAEEALRQSEERFRLLYEEAPIGYQSLDEEGRVLTVNKTWLALLGYASDEVIGRPFGEFLVPSQQGLYQERFSRFRAAGEVHDVEFEMVRKDGSRFLGLFDGVIGRDDRGAFRQTHCTMHDVTERRRAEQALRESEERLRTVVANAPLFLFATDRDGVVMLSEGKGLESIGRGQGDAVGQSAFDRYGDIPEVVGNMRRALAGESFTAVVELRGATLEIHHVPIRDNQGQVTGMIGVATDITERKRAEQALRDSEERLRQVLEVSLEPIYRLDLRTGTYDYVSPSICRVLGFTPKELVAMGFQGVARRVHPKDRQRVRLSLGSLRDHTAQRGGEPREYRCRHKNGEYRWLSDSRALIRDRDGRPVAIVGTVSDITERKRAEEALRSREKEVRVIAENVPALFSYVDAQARYRFVNKRYGEWFGLAPTEIIGKHYGDIVGREAYALIKHRVHRVLSGERVSYEEALPYKYGGKRWVTADYVPDSDDRGTVRGFFALVVDITERKRAEEALRESEERLRLLAENARDIIYRYRLSPTRGFEYVSPAATTISGYTPEEHYANPNLTFSMIHPRDREALRQVIDEGATAPIVLRWIRKDGASVWTEQRLVPIYDDAGNRVALEGIARDVTERHLAEEALRESEERYRRLVQDSVDGIVVVEGEEIAFVNPTLVRMMGCRRDKEMVGHPFTDFVSREHRRLMAERGRARERGEDVPDRYEFKAMRKDGSEFDAELSVGMITYHGRPARQGIIREVTERKRAEEELEQHRHHLAALVEERTAEVTALNTELEAFVHSVSHDLRAPLRSIDGFSRALLEDLGERLDEAALDSVRRVRGATQRMKQLMEDLLALSHVTKTEIRDEAVDLSDLAKTIAGELLDDEPERKVTFEIADGLTARGDPSLLQMALENLLDNAWKFTSRHETGHIEFGSAKIGRELAYFVRDDGVGFDMAGRERLFVPFQRLHAESDFPGSGIGLPTVQRVVHRHGGRVWAEGSPEGGATFYFTLAGRKGRRRQQPRPKGRPRRSPGQT